MNIQFKKFKKYDSSFFFSNIFIHFLLALSVFFSSQAFSLGIEKNNLNNVANNQGVSSSSIETRCRPDGLYVSPVRPNYCLTYDAQGRELMGGKSRRVIGYFTSWRTGAGDRPAYLVPDIPWQDLTHINYAFAHVNAQHKISVGSNLPTNASIGMEWPDVVGADMDPAFSYKGHFNLLNKYKKQYPHVKTLIAVGGWAETGGYFDDTGKRIASGGFYRMTTKADGSINHAGINTFADSAVAFLRQYGFNGLDIDYEYPSSMRDSGNPDDFSLSNPIRGGLNASFNVLMKVLREKLDAAGAADGTYYLLTAAVPSSGYLLRGMEVFESLQYMDFVNVMSYDLHGSWNQFVGPNAALFDDGQDAELLFWSAYGGQYENIGYLNTDWAFHYYRGSMPAGRINLGVPYYTRGWKDVQGGTHGLWGTASLPDQQNCPPGTGIGRNKCGNGATGIDNLWHDEDPRGLELAAGSNPMWHAKNLQQGIAGDYLTRYGLDPVNNPDHKLTGNYVRHYSDSLVAPWLWNKQKRVFLSMEDEQSIAAKADYIVEKGIGGVMFWELAGDYQYNAAKGQYEMGSTLTSLLANKLSRVSAYGNRKAEIEMPQQQLDISVTITDFKLGDQNYPITPSLIITNNTGQTLPPSISFTFDMATTVPEKITDQSESILEVISSGANIAGNNIGGLENNFHRLKLTTPSHKAIVSGGQLKEVINYYLPTSKPSNWIVTIGNKTFALKSEHPDLPAGEVPSGGASDTCSAIGVNPADYPTYPNWPHGDHAEGGNKVVYKDSVFKAKWYTSSRPGSDSSWEALCSI